MPIRFASLVFAGLLGWAATDGRANPLEAPVPWNSFEHRLMADASDGALDETPLLAASLVAGGVSSEEELQRYGRAFDQLCEQLYRAPLLQAVEFEKSSDATIAYNIHRFLHERILVGEYRADCNAVQQTLEEGTYNCVTASILFQCLAERFQLRSEMLATDTHLFCRTSGKVPYYVELTSENSLASIRLEPLTCLARVGTSASGVTAETAGRGVMLESAQVPPRALTASQVISKIYYNRAVASLERKDFARALDWLRTAAAFDPQDKTIAQNLLAGINNWALAECDAGNYLRASELLACGRKASSAFGPFASNDLHVHQKWAMTLCESDRFSDALDVLERGYRRRPDVPLFLEGRVVVWQAWVAALRQQDKLDDARVVVNQALRQFPENAALLQLRKDLTQ